MMSLLFTQWTHDAIAAAKLAKQDYMLTPKNVRHKQRPSEDTVAHEQEGPASLSHWEYEQKTKPKPKDERQQDSNRNRNRGQNNKR